ncbi:hypothetical protein [Rhodococcus wratislaviensis]|uniref:hypothetical protein n=1 Tax=Rhodococcus wratislaviensis TaxID=44752 RepID=UPI003515E8D8
MRREPEPLRWGMEYDTFRISHPTSLLGLAQRPTEGGAAAPALAIELGRPLTDDEVALHEVCDNPICVRASLEALGRPHVVLGTQAQNLAGMGAKGRGGGRGQTWHWYGPDRAARAARSRALREAVRGGWDDEAVQAAFLHTDTPTLF